MVLWSFFTEYMKALNLKTRVRDVKWSTATLKREEDQFAMRVTIVFFRSRNTFNNGDYCNVLFH